ncbi:1,2-phenylacetyl-CoA epoxidase subunit PaaC [Halocatena pleomorpha]|uniref:Phenylacetate-CoA oxygenase subunit PaaI n=1 Tax=Halocatena pleomorpha TaxID=1785090 RepID=A0A3P3R6M7_9EURY|nr:1,2-phenylacetyl-CoA epoxidase subunit PaaC [Halocatena pleomorpha]RRJ29117.1 phenylacetate-CoA oxygenase subunit PaaI [Halocatena pleomorpha]
MATNQQSDPDELTDRQQAAVETLLFSLADDEFVLAERYTEWQVRAPTLESDLALSNIAQDELGHARLWYDLLTEFDYTESELLFERDPADFTHAALVELPFADGDWADAIVRSYLYDTAEQLRLAALEDAAYTPIADRIGKIRSEEAYHREHAENWLERLCADPDGRANVQAATDRLFPHALALFEPVDAEHEATIREFGLRSESLADLRERWLSITVPLLDSLGVRPPVSADGSPPELPVAYGRGGEHTEQWPVLHAELTRTYRELDRTNTRTITNDPDHAR